MFHLTQKPLLGGRTKHIQIVVLLYLLSLSWGRLSMGSQESKLQFPTGSPHIIVQQSARPNQFVQKGALWSLTAAAAGNGDFPAVLKQEPEGELSLSQASSSCCIGF